MSQMKFVSFIVVLAFVSCTNVQAQVISSGICPCDLEVKANFDISQYMGLWYEYARYPVYFEADGKCVTAEYTLQKDGKVSVKNSLVNEKTGAPVVANGYATIESNAKLTVVFPPSPATTTSNYWVLDTDYCTYSVIYSCQPVEKQDKHSTIVWIMTRDRVPSKETIETAKAVLKKNNISLDPLTVTKQSGCK